MERPDRGARHGWGGGWPPAAVVETHVSTVFFYGDHVVKVPKPVAFSFVDFTELDRRRENCEREVALNRRLAPDVYLGTATVTLAGRPVEHGVVMRRLPAERNFEQMVRAGRPVEADLERLAAVLADFHGRAERSARTAAAATPPALWQRWQNTAEELSPFIGPVVDARRYQELTRLASRYLAGRGPLLEDRIRGGHIVDGHGDLQAADIFFLDDGPRILDCLEFDDRLRYGDWVADLAFLAADLEHLGAEREAGLLLDAYRRRAPESPPPSLFDFYVAARAQVRMLVECLRHPPGGPDPGGASGRFLDVALEHLRRGAVRLVLVGGPPGAGKSSLAAWLADRTGAEVLSSDVVRDGVGPSRGEAGRYAGPAVDAVYQALCDRAGELLGFGRSVILDATWTTAERRRMAAQVAQAAVADLHELRCDCPDDVRAARVGNRPRGGPGTSEATPEVAADLAAAADPWPTAAAVDCSTTVEHAGRSALQLIAGCPG
ncbi:MAG TPA: AAA family ATPase [Acidimicrobiales bacterium]|nr:AAA family ATPase [Acidimicrobiales bacterium]